MQHVIEFDRLTQAEINRMCKWTTTCAFRKWHTLSKGSIFAFVFEDRYDAERFVMKWSTYFNDSKTIE